MQLPFFSRAGRFLSRDLLFKKAKQKVKILKISTLI